ncbi:hypothetical protein [Lelliottia sp. CFBP8978]|jgi:probable RcsB/C two-component-system connector|uniref:hypothetical protein n=1 Tax=Lelliottia sp. CFBP8978 TaxID=3096522 RepID=UPI002A6ADC1E|nr:hypothetical protein [Lelliottia sp. CFBP8978]MDY1035460.1 hypothetical protein [Lelliottia sp. CFBP8978]
MRSENEQLADELIGEAVLSLLKEHGPLSKQSLLRRLRDMEASEKDDRRRAVIAEIIAEVSARSTPFAQRKKARQQRDLDGLKSEQNDNVFPLFGRGKPGGNKNIH